MVRKDGRCIQWNEGGLRVVGLESLFEPPWRSGDRWAISLRTNRCVDAVLWMLCWPLTHKGQWLKKNGLV